MKRTWRNVLHRLAEWGHRPPLEYREYVVQSEGFMTDVRRLLLRQIRARLARDRPHWRIETTL
ncbi:MAG: hypothetical protein HYY23_15115 [Verrucomicrobia bacterium]|nr:hypothetical protein [Verrucomicrobiota bacterium]